MNCDHCENRAKEVQEHEVGYFRYVTCSVGNWGLKLQYTKQMKLCAKCFQLLQRLNQIPYILTGLVVKLKTNPAFCYMLMEYAKTEHICLHAINGNKAFM